MELDSTIRKAVDWLTLALSSVFLLIGLAILTGLLFSEHTVFSPGIRIVVGLILAGYGIFRGISTYKRITSTRKGADDAQK